ncbi:MAG: hypothetical protein WBE80_07375 [Methylocella sp.]
MAVSTSFFPLGPSWTALGAASTKPVTLMATGGPIEVIASSSGAPAAGAQGVLINPQTGPVVTLSYNSTTTPYVGYAIAAAGQTNAGVWILTGD